MKKTRKRYRFAVALVLLLAVMVGSSIPTAYGIDINGVDISNYDTIDAYFIEIPLMSLEQQPKFLPAPGNVFSRSVNEMQIKITFNKILFAPSDEDVGLPIFIMGRLDVNLPSAFGRKIHFMENKVLPLSNNYYKWLKLHEAELDFNNIRMELGFGGAMLSVENGNIFKKSTTFTFSEKVRLFTVGVPPEQADPTHPDFDIDFGNTGSNLAPPPNAVDPILPPSVSLWERIADAFMAVFNGTAGAGDWIIVALVVIVGLFAIGLLGKALNFAFGK